jgi:hypothetical protein
MAGSRWPPIPWTKMDMPLLYFETSTTLLCRNFRQSKSIFFTSGFENAGPQRSANFHRIIEQKPSKSWKTRVVNRANSEEPIERGIPEF